MKKNTSYLTQTVCLKKNYLKETTINIFRVLIILAVGTIVLAFVSGPSAAEPKAGAIIVGVAPGPYGDLFKKAIKPGLEKKGYNWSFLNIFSFPRLTISNT
jgi:D-methionine transport system substrate-binding protein